MDTTKIILRGGSHKIILRGVSHKIILRGVSHKNGNLNLIRVNSSKHLENASLLTICSGQKTKTENQREMKFSIVKTKFKQMKITQKWKKFSNELVQIHTKT